MRLFAESQTRTSLSVLIKSAFLCVRRCASTTCWTSFAEKSNIHKSNKQLLKSNISDLYFSLLPTDYLKFSYLIFLKFQTNWAWRCLVILPVYGNGDSHTGPISNQYPTGRVRSFSPVATLHQLAKIRFKLSKHNLTSYSKSRL